jgi:hypothetical protein
VRRLIGGTTVRRVILISVVAASFAVAGKYVVADRRGDTVALALLLPDGADLRDPLVTAWTDAAREEGVPLHVITTNDFLRPVSLEGLRFAGIILPDSVHTAANDVLLGKLKDYVDGGGALMIVFDAATLSIPFRTYASRWSRLSGLAGIEYAFYDELGANTTRFSPIMGSRGAFLSLDIAPGKFTLPDSDDVPLPSASTPGTASAQMLNEYTLSGYGYQAFEYGHYVTRGEYAGRELLYTPSGDVIAGVRNQRQGHVLFVNLQLGYLKTQTDGLLLHGFLHYFATELAGLPALSAAPRGRGGLVMNWHVDAEPAIEALEELKHSAIFRQGPYSVHVTAGPDVDEFGDGGGFDAPRSAEAQRWLKFFAARGDQVGSHGGWIHNYFGYNVGENNRDDFEQYLALNKAALEKVTRRPVTEYSAPVGTHPTWVTSWLEANDIHAYYFTGNTGMGPTRTYRDGKRSARSAWAFPVLTLGANASFEELAEDEVPAETVATWLESVAQFAADRHVIRLVYFHPPGLLEYQPEPIERWLSRTARLSALGRFAWYTMTDVADFLDRREGVDWRVDRNASGDIVVTATHADSLERQAWFVPAQRYVEPRIRDGAGDVTLDAGQWIVRAAGGQRLVFSAASRDAGRS